MMDLLTHHVSRVSKFIIHHYAFIILKQPSQENKQDSSGNGNQQIHNQAIISLVVAQSASNEIAHKAAHNAQDDVDEHGVARPHESAGQKTSNATDDD